MTNLSRAVVILVAVVACAAIAACGGSSTTSEHAAPARATYAVTVASQNSTPSYVGNYIKITGTRNGIADLKYPCASQFTLCLPIGQNGTVEPITDLCPSDDDNKPLVYPRPTYDGKWTFTYTLYSNDQCLTPRMVNLDCPDTTNETLGIGATVTNNILCITHNATLDVNVCIVDPATGAHSGTNCCMPSGAPCGGANPLCCTGLTCNSNVCSTVP